MYHQSFVTTELSRFHDLRRRLIADDPQIDETTLLDTLEGATNLHEAVTILIRSGLEDEAMASGLRGRMDELETRLRRLEARAAKKRAHVLAIMEDAGLEKIVAPDVTISLRPMPPSVAITDESLVPEWFYVPQPPKLDRRKILDVLKAGEQVLGAELAAPKQCLSVRTK